MIGQFFALNWLMVASLALALLAIALRQAPGHLVDSIGGVSAAVAADACFVLSLLAIGASVAFSGHRVITFLFGCSLDH